jgi:hypothetical protein
MVHGQYAVEMPSVYIETTIPSYYYSVRSSVQALAWRAQTRLWWDAHRRRYQLFTSLAVLSELQDGQSERVAPRIDLLAGLEHLAITASVEATAEYYLQQKLMPRSAKVDALHVALASCHRIDFLLTWNCQHIANANKTRHLEVLNKRMGLPIPVLATPYNLVQEKLS